MRGLVNPDFDCKWPIMVDFGHISGQSATFSSLLVSTHGLVNPDFAYKRRYGHCFDHGFASIRFARRRLLR